MGAYDRVQYKGQTFNRRTVAALRQAEFLFYMLGGKGTISYPQGSYSKGPNSAGTHEGGGAEDSYLSVDTVENHLIWQWALRLVGFADWLRTPTRAWRQHNHGILIGDKEMSDEAHDQVQYYYGGYDGLAGYWSGGVYVHRKDPHPRKPNPIPVFRYPLGIVDLSNVTREAKKTTGYVELTGVKHIQRALNFKLGTDLVVDGKFGKMTKAAYKTYEHLLDSPFEDGIPGEFSLNLLGAARFRVKA